MCIRDRGPIAPISGLQSFEQLLTHGTTTQLGAAFCHQIPGAEATGQNGIHSSLQIIGSRGLFEADAQHHCGREHHGHGIGLVLTGDVGG